MIICEVGIKMVNLEFQNYRHYFVRSMYIYLSCKHANIYVISLVGA
jgi:hypothetical protein